MRRRPRVGLLVLTTAALLVASADATGRWYWRRALRRVSVDPKAAAVRLSTDPWLSLPGVVEHSRRLPLRELAEVPRGELDAVMLRVSDEQIRWFPADRRGYAYRIRAGMLGDRIDGALSDLYEALRRDPTSPGLHRLAALVQYQTGSYQQCLDHLAEAAALGGDTGTPGVDLFEEDRDWVRLEGLRRRLERYPRQRVPTVLGLAEELRRRNREEEGRRLLESEPRHPEIELVLARWESDAGSYSSAAARLESVARRSVYPSQLRARAWAQLAQTRDQAGDTEAALDAAREALRLAPSSVAPYLALAVLAEHRGDDGQALEHLRRAWGMAPADVSVLLRVARAAERTGNIADARLALERAVQVRPEEPALVAQLVGLLMRQGQYMDATMRLSRALDRFPTDENLLRLAEQLRSEVLRDSNRPNRD